MKPLSYWEGLTRTTILTISVLTLNACGDTESVSTNDFTRGEAMEVENNNPNATPISGNQSNDSSTMGNNCQTATDCDEFQVCDTEIFQCVPIPTNGEQIPDAGSQSNEDQDTGSNQGLGNGCSSTQDIQFFQGELVCKQGCEDAYSTANEQCQQTPSRIADCLAEAAQLNQECQVGCPGLVRLISNCLSECATNSNDALCGATCVRQGVSFSEVCFACIEHSINCGANRCQTSCFTNDSSVCEACIYASCEQDFEDCAGIPLP
ncbi:MAG: hypothetical protein ACPGQS_00920 [Bradymonadia bacterium]